MTATMPDDIRLLRGALDRVSEEVERYPVNTRGFMTQILAERALVEHSSRGVVADYEGWIHQNYQDLLLLHAEPVVAPLRTDTVVGDMALQECYANCANVVGIYSDEYTYVEGIAQANALIVRHAWLLDGNGDVIDPTWSSLGHRPGFLASYLGVRFTTEFLVSHTLRTGWHSFFDADWHQEHEILRRGLKINDAGLAYDLGDES